MSLKRRRVADGSIVQVYEPQPIKLANLVINVALAPTQLVFRVPTPDARVQVKIALIAVPTLSTAAPSAPPIPFDVTYGGIVSLDLWLSAREVDENSGLHLPVVNLIGTAATPQAVPTDPGLMVLSQDVQGGQDSVWGVLDVAVDGTGDASSIALFVQCRYSPLVDMCLDEWQRIAGELSPALVGLPITMAGSE
jgi:hypothetical protein